MENQDTISIRVSRLNNIILGLIDENTNNMTECLSREGLLDALFLLYDECAKDSLKRKHKNILEFVNKYRPVINEAKTLRVKNDDFEIKNLIGKGYFGEVHLVSEKLTGNYYALKSIKKVTLTSEQIYEERNIMSKRCSEWLTNLKYAYQDNDNLYLVMEYLPGGDLLNLMTRMGKFDEKLAKFYLAEIIMATNALHNTGYIHRDIKPENILLDRFGHIKLGDFGNAALLNKNGNVISIKPVGTPDYIAPELLETLTTIKLKKSIHNIKCDYWSIGIIAYEFVTETTPFHDENVHETYSKILCHNEDRKKITYPKDAVVSDMYKDLINNLVTNQKYRFTFKDLTKHTFFNDINWNNIRNEVPPFIPNIKNDEDISNFNDIDKTLKRKNTYNKDHKQTNIGNINDFSGHNLPFIGYSFIYNDNENNSIYSHNSINNDNNFNIDKINDMENIIKNQKQEIKKLNNDILSCEKRTIKMDTVNKILFDTKAELNILKDKLKEKTIELSKGNIEIKTLKNSLKIEEEMRMKNDKILSELLSSTYQKWEKSKKISDENYEKQICEKIKEIKLINDKLFLLQDELNSKRNEFIILEKNFNNYKDLLKMTKEQNLNDKNDLNVYKNDLVKNYDKIILDLRSNNKILLKQLNDKNNDTLLIKNNYEELLNKYNNLEITNNLLNENLNKIKLNLNHEIDVNKKLREELIILHKKNDELLININQYDKRLSLLTDAEQSRTSSPYLSANGSLNEIHNVMDNDEVILLKENELKERKRAEGLEDIIKNLETLLKNNDMNKMLEKKDEKLENINEKLIIETQQLRQTNLKLWKLEKQYDNTVNENKQLTRRLDLNADIIRKLKDDKLNNEKIIKENNDLIKLKTNEINNLSNDIISSKTLLDNEHKMLLKNEEELNVIKLEKMNLVNKINTIENELNLLKNNYKLLSNNFIKLTEENKSYLHKYNEKISEINALNEDLDDTNMKMNGLNKNYNMLKDVCNLTDIQMTELEVMYNDEKKLNENNMEKINNMINKLNEKDNNIFELKNEINKMELNNNLLENNLKQLNNDLLDEKSKNSDLQQTIKQNIEEANNNIDIINKLELNNELLLNDINNVKKINMNVNNELLLIKEENSKVITELYVNKEHNKNLLDNINEKVYTINLLNKKINNMNKIINDINIINNENNIKNNTIIMQQKKLINYLQIKVNNYENKKKKTFTDILFGTNSNNNNNNTNNLLNDNNLIEKKQYIKQLEDDLKCEKLKNNKLKEQLLKTKIDLRNFNKDNENKENIDTIQIKREIDNFNSIETLLPLTKSYESNCNLVDDIDDLPSIDSETSESEEKNSEIEQENEVLDDIKDLNLSLKKHNFILTLEDNNNMAIKCTVCYRLILLRQPYWKCKTCNLSIHRKCRNNLIINCGDNNYDTKSTTESITTIATTSSATSSISEIGEENVNDYNGDVLVNLNQFNKQLQVNTLFELNDNLLLLGCNTGLYSYNIKKNLLIQINGIDNVNYFDINLSINKTIIIGTDNKFLYQLDINNLINCCNVVKNKLVYTILDIPFANRTTVETWHMIKLHKLTNISESDTNNTDENHDDNMIAIAATTLRIVILKYDKIKKLFKPVRALDTSIKITSILFTNFTAIICSDKFYEIDLNTYVPEEFLDLSNININNISLIKPLKLFYININEYLLCYKNYGIFVDMYGSKSRLINIQWLDKPIDFYYCEPLLFVTHYNYIQIIKIDKNYKENNDDENDNSNIKRIYIRNLQQPKILTSYNNYGIYIINNNNYNIIMKLDGMKIYNKYNNSSLLTLNELTTSSDTLTTN